MTMNKVNERIDIVALGFKKNLAIYPSRMQYHGMVYSFIDAGLRILSKSNGAIYEFFTMSDGISSFHLKFDRQARNWFLLSITN